MDNELYTLQMTNTYGAFRTEDGTLLVECLFVNSKHWISKYVPENDIFVGSVYEAVYKPAKNGLYKVTFTRKED